MKFKLNTAAAAILAASMIGSPAYAADGAPPAKKHVTKKAPAKPAGPTVEEQIQSLRQECRARSTASSPTSPTRMPS
jgi:cytochrome c-type biogenesis protein CcmH/NrfG